MSFRLAIEGPVAVAWRSVDALQTAVERALVAATGDTDMASLAGIATGELLENAVKYADASQGAVRVHVQAGEDGVRIAVTSPASAASAARVEQLVAGIAAAMPAEAYRARMVAIAQGAQGGLGLLRVVAECGCTLTAERGAGTLTVTAVMVGRVSDKASDKASDRTLRVLTAQDVLAGARVEDDDVLRGSALRAVLAAHDGQRAGFAEDMARAARVQRSLLGRLPATDALGTAALFQPAEIVGGDFFEVQLAGRRARVLLADTTGHGVQAALRTTLLKSLVETVRARASSPAELLALLNDAALGHGGIDLQFAALCADIDLSPDPDDGLLRVTLASAGMPSALIVRATEAVEVYVGGPLLGVAPTVTVPERELALAPGERLALCSDGLVDQLDARDERPTVEDLARALRAPALHDVPQAVAAALASFRGAVPQGDDVALVVFEHRPGVDPDASLIVTWSAV